MEARAVDVESRIPTSATKEEALKNAIWAAELYMEALKSASSKPEMARLKKLCSKALKRAEDIKKVQNWTATTESDRKLPDLRAAAQELLSRRTLSRREEIILLESSRLHGLVFPPWTSAPKEDEFKQMLAGKIYVDSPEMKISETQKKVFAGWKRPDQALRKTTHGSSEAQNIEPTMVAFGDIDLVQDVTTDCSVVASLCAAVAQPRNGYEKLLKSVFHPYDNLGGRPRISKNGKYIFRLHFNGCFRKVVIDDRLPTSTSSRTLHVIDRQNPGLLWPALIEKAYLKVRGGYDFPGSNSGTDLWVLTGWVPEQIFLRSDELQPQQLWDRVSKSFGLGDVVITLGTGRLSPTEEEFLGLAGEHDYAVLEMKNAGDQLWLLVKNPWCDGTVWKGMRPMPKESENITNSWTENLRHSLVEERLLSPGTFWISFDEVVCNFETIYLNWNPALFEHRQDHHFAWTIPALVSPGCFTHNPQYSLKSSTGGTVWILLSRHFTTEEHNLLSPSSSTNSSTSSPLGFISLYVFNKDGQRVHLSDDALHRGPFVDSPQTLARLDMPADATYTLAVAQQMLPLPKYFFSLSIYSRDPVGVELAANRYRHSTVLNGVWTSRTAGGNASATSYPSNPQFRISVTSVTDLNLLLETTRLELPVHVKMVWAGGDRATAVTAKDIVGESGDYRRGCAMAKISNVPAGSYTIVCSTFESGQTGKFTLLVESMVPCDVTSLPSEDAGCLSVRLPTLLLQGEIDRMLAPMTVSRMARLKIIARHSDRVRKGSGSPLKVSVERGQGPHKTILSISGDGDFSDAPSGVRVADVDVSPEMVTRGGVWLVVERFGATEVADEIEVEILSEASVQVGAWGTGHG